jgi:lauroyl/myristoyl acyltransferase
MGTHDTGHRTVEASVTSCESAVPGWRPRWYAHRYNRPGLYRLAGALAWLPRALRLRVAGRIGGVAAARLPRERAAARTALNVFTGRTGAALDALTVQLFAEFAMCFADLLSTNRRAPHRLDPVVGRVTGIERVGALESGLVSVTAHVGNWDMAGRLLARVSARPTNVVVAPEEAAALEPWVRRTGGGVRFVSRAQPTVSLGLIAALRRGEAVGIQGDRALGTRGDTTLLFFGRPAPFPVGPFRLAAAAGVPVLPAFCTLGPDLRYDMTAHAPLVLSRGSEEDALRAWVRHLERLVEERPTQWFNFFDIWNPFGV